jgi:hypothetical protein
MYTRRCPTQRRATDLATRSVHKTKAHKTKTLNPKAETNEWGQQGATISGLALSRKTAWYIYMYIPRTMTAHTLADGPASAAAATTSNGRQRPFPTAFGCCCG